MEENEVTTPEENQAASPEPEQKTESTQEQQATANTSSEGNESGTEEPTELENFLDNISEEQPKSEPEKPTEAGDQNTDDQEETLLAEVRTERGKGRIKELLNGHRSLKEQFGQVKAENENFSRLLAETNLPPEGIAKVFDFCRLAATNDENNLKVALQVLDETRADICRRLGLPQPGKDPLGDFEDLRKAVDDFEISEDKALELAKLRRQERLIRQDMQSRHEMAQAEQHFRQRVASAIGQTEAMLKQIAQSDPHYPSKYAQLKKIMSDKRFTDQMASQFEPEQWPFQIKFLYENLNARPATPSPLRPSRSALGRQAAGNDTQRNVMRIFDELGI